MVWNGSLLLHSTFVNEILGLSLAGRKQNTDRSFGSTSLIGLLTPRAFYVSQKNNPHMLKLWLVCSVNFCAWQCNGWYQVFLFPIWFVRLLRIIPVVALVNSVRWLKAFSLRMDWNWMFSMELLAYFIMTPNRWRSLIMHCEFVDRMFNPWWALRWIINLSLLRRQWHGFGIIMRYCSSGDHLLTEMRILS